MPKLRILAVAAAFGLLATTAASATALEPPVGTWADQHRDFSISADVGMPSTARGLDVRHHGYWPPTEHPTY